jgi:hypothetical protein
MSKEKKSLSPEEIVTESTVGRRAAVGLIGGIALGAGALTLGVTQTAQAIPGCTDRDPSDPAGNGRGRSISDSDPRDPAGCGSRACSDSDPSDPAGRGRRC